MNLDYVTAEVSRIEAMKDDDEAAHSTEDALREEFIEWLTEQSGVPANILEMATVILSTNDIKFSRWCA